MKNSIKFLFLAAIAIAFASCDNKPSTMSYTMVSNFSYVAEYPEKFKTVDSLYYNKNVMLDDYSALCTKCEDMNNGFISGWKVSMKKGSATESVDLQMFASAGPYAGLYDKNSRQGNKAYAVFAGSTSEYDVVFKYGSYFTKSTCFVQGLWINNTKLVETLAEKGQIADGDFLKVTATFFKNNLPVCTEDFVLVDYTGAEHKIVKEWTAWEMKKASKCDVDAIKFSVSASSAALPEAFCVDAIVASISVEY